MKKLILVAFLISATIAGKAQILPSFQFGVKGGINLSNFSTDNTFNSDNRAGYLAGAWLRVGALGINFQPEVYYASKVATFTTTTSGGAAVNSVTLKSIDVPALVGFKVGTFGVGGRFYTGPVVSFILSNEQAITMAFEKIGRLNFKDQAYAWQLGAGVDIAMLSIDLRYEKGLSNLNSNGYDQKLNLFNLTAAYKLF